MKIVVISGSPHRHGTSAVLVDSLIRGVQEAGHEVFRFDAAFCQVHPCLACQKCQNDGGQCVYNDDMEELYQNLLSAGAVVFASPIYYNDICGQLKVVIDRFYAKEDSLRIPKRAALMLAFGDASQNAVKGVYLNFRAMLDFFGWTLADADIIAGCGCNCAADIEKTDFPQLAYELGKRIGTEPSGG